MKSYAVVKKGKKTYYLLNKHKAVRNDKNGVIDVDKYIEEGGAYVEEKPKKVVSKKKAVKKKKSKK